MTGRELYADNNTFRADIMKRVMLAAALVAGMWTGALMVIDGINAKGGILGRNCAFAGSALFPSPLACRRRA